MIPAITGDLEHSGSRAQELSSRMVSWHQIPFGKIYCSEGLGHCSAGLNFTEGLGTVLPPSNDTVPCSELLWNRPPEMAVGFWISGKLQASAFYVGAILLNMSLLGKCLVIENNNDKIGTSVS